MKLVIRILHSDVAKYEKSISNWQSRSGEEHVMACSPSELVETENGWRILARQELTTDNERPLG